MKKRWLVIALSAAAVFGFVPGATTMAATTTASLVTEEGSSISALEAYDLARDSEVRESVSTAMPRIVEGAEWWTSFSEYYVTKGDFDVTFDIEMDDTLLEDAGNAPALVFCTDANRGRKGYSEYFTLNMYYSENDLITVDGNLPRYEADWNDWRIWKTAMKGSTSTVNVKRKGNNFTVTIETLGSDGDSYKSTVEFTTAADDVMRMFWVPDNNGFTIKQFTKETDYLQKELPDGVTRRDGIFEIFPDSSCVSGGGVNVEVDMSAILTSPDEEVVTTEVGSVKKVTGTIGGNQQSFLIKVLNENLCKSCKVVEGNGATVEVGEAFDFTLKVTGADPDSPVTEAVTYAAITSDYEMSCVDKGDGLYLFHVIPKTAIEGAVEVVCGYRTAYCVYTATVPSMEVPTGPSIETPTGPGIETPTGPGIETPTGPSIEAPTGPSIETPSKPDIDVSNKCKSLTSMNGNTINVWGYSVCPIVITATQEDLTRDMTDEIICLNGTVVDKMVSRTETGAYNMVFAVRPTGSAEKLVFKCGDQELTITLIVNTTTTHYVPVTTPSADTSTGTSTDDQTTETPAEDNEEPEEPAIEEPEYKDPIIEIPEDEVSPSIPPISEYPSVTEPENTETEKPVVSKKKTIKVSSVKAKKVKGVAKVYGKVTKKATVKVTAKGKTLKTTAGAKGNFTIKFSKAVSKKIKSGTKIKFEISKSGYKKKTMTFTVKWVSL